MRRVARGEAENGEGGIRFMVFKGKRQETRFENRKIKLEGVGEARKVEERREGKGREAVGKTVTQKGGGEKERKRERTILKE